MADQVQPVLDYADAMGSETIAQAAYYHRARTFKPWIEQSDYVTGELSVEELIGQLQTAGLTLTYRQIKRHHNIFLFESETAVAQISGNGWEVSSADETLTRNLGQVINACYRKSEPPQGQVHVSFTYCERDYPHTNTRPIDVPAWESIRDNYAPATQTALEKLMALEKPEHGRLVVFNGPPGTGKTYAIRSLIGAWDPWCYSTYVIDPEEFFRSRSYMLRLLPDPEDQIGTAEEDPEFKVKPYTIFLFDDADEYLVADSKERKGQEIARFLNVLDGFIGQGLKIIFLLTTNQGIEKLNEAAVRPGRCLANIEFERFSEPQAREWLARHDYQGGLPTSQHGIGMRLSRANQTNYSLAELFSCLRNES